MVPTAATFVAELGAPYEANWNDYPRPQNTFYWVTGKAARALGLFPTANALLLGAHVLATLAFFGVARYLRCRPAWAAAGAVAYGTAHYLWYRNLAHLALSLYWHLPLAVLVLGFCARRHGLRVRSRRFAFAVAVAVVTALSAVYYAAMFVILLILSALLQVARRQWRRAAAPAALAAAVLGLFAIENLGTLRYPLEHGRNLLAVQRSYGDLEHYALKPIELFLPPPGRGPLGLGSLGTGYWDNARGEIGSAYLGLGAIAGFLSLLSRPLRGLVRGRAFFLSSALSAVACILSFSVAGGVNGVLGSVGVVFLRGTNRFSIWIAAVCLLHLVLRASRSGLATARSGGAAALFALLALFDQLPPFVRGETIATQSRAVATDRAFAASLEGALRGRPMVFMLPVLAYPEGGFIRQMPDYEHFRPYLFTERVRYSYGTDKGRPREDWQWRVAAMAPDLMVERLESYGFSGIVLDRLGYADGGAAVLEGLAKAGRPITVDEPGRGRALVRLQPRAPARLPASAPEPGRGWYGRPQAEGLWAREAEAEWIFTNAASTPARARLAFVITVMTPRTVSLMQEGRTLGSWRVEDSVRIGGLEARLPPGDSRMVLRSDRAPELTEIGNRLRMATFAVTDLELDQE